MNGDAWWDAAGDWVRASSAAAGYSSARLRRDEARVRPWGTTATVDTAAGPLVFKAVEPRRSFEVTLTRTVADGWPVLAPELHATDDQRGWMLMSHHGEPIAEVLPPMQQVDALCSLLPHYGAMQRGTAGLVDGLVAAGVPDRRLDVLPAQFESFLRAGTLADDLVGRCVGRLPRLRDSAAVLLDPPVPAAIEHADVHGMNVLTREGQARLIDWGDCCVSHPFTALFVPQQFVVAALPAPARAEAGRRMRDAYLEPWGGASTTNLALLDSALFVAPLVRVLSLAAEVDGAAEIDDLLHHWCTVS